MENSFVDYGEVVIETSGKWTNSDNDIIINAPRVRHGRTGTIVIEIRENGKLYFGHKNDLLAGQEMSVSGKKRTIRCVCIDIGHQYFRFRLFEEIK